SVASWEEGSLCPSWFCSLSWRCRRSRRPPTCSTCSTTWSAKRESGTLSSARTSTRASTGWSNAWRAARISRVHGRALRQLVDRRHAALRYTLLARVGGLSDLIRFSLLQARLREGAHRP